MRIGIFTDSYLPRVDGVVTMVRLQKEYLTKLGHEVFVVSATYPDYEDSDNNIVRLSSFDPLPFGDIKTMNSSPFSKKNYEVLTSLELDIIHTHTQSGIFILSHKLSKENNIPHVVTFHTNLHELVDYYPWTTATSSILGLVASVFGMKNTDGFTRLIRHPFPTKLQTKKRLDDIALLTVNAVDQVVTISAHGDEYIKSLGSKTPVTMVGNGINLNKYSAKKSNGSHLKAVYSGRLSGEKRHDLVIAAIARVKGVNLTIIGDGPTMSDCERLVNELGVSNRVKFTGEVIAEEVAKIIKNNDVGVLASYKFDNAPLVIMEYLASGLPVVYCDSNFDNMVSPASSVLCEPTVDGFTEAFDKLGQADIKQKSRAAITDSKKHDIRIKTKQLESIYRNLISKSD